MSGYELGRLFDGLGLNPGPIETEASSRFPIGLRVDAFSLGISFCAYFPHSHSCCDVGRLISFFILVAGLKSRCGRFDDHFLDLYQSSGNLLIIFPASLKRTASCLEWLSIYLLSPIT
jgi:hypothetical protein